MLTVRERQLSKQQVYLTSKLTMNKLSNSLSKMTKPRDLVKCLLALWLSNLRTQPTTQLIREAKFREIILHKPKEVHMLRMWV